MNKVSLFITVLITITLFSGCEHCDVKIHDEDFLNTKHGTSKNQRLIHPIIEEKKIIKKEIIVEKKVIKKKVVKKKVNMTVQEKKQKFKDTLVPIITAVYQTLNNQYESVLRDMQTNHNHKFIETLKVQYKAKTDEELLAALKPHPISIVLAQSAIESAWLTSRFTKKAKNIFGVWSFNKNEPRIEANATRGTKRIYLKKYKTFKGSIVDYYKTLGKTWAYSEFRKQRLLTDDPYKLVAYLTSYSEKGKVYTETLKNMIKYNKFDEYDIK